MAGGRPIRIPITGEAGFIESAVARLAVAQGHEIEDLDAMSYAANPADLAQVAGSPLCAFERADIRDRVALGRVLARHRLRR